MSVFDVTQIDQVALNSSETTDLLTIVRLDPFGQFILTNESTVLENVLRDDDGSSLYQTCDSRTTIGEPGTLRPPGGDQDLTHGLRTFPFQGVENVHLTRVEVNAEISPPGSVSSPCDLVRLPSMSDVSTGFPVPLQAELLSHVEHSVGSPPLRRIRFLQQVEWRINAVMMLVQEIQGRIIETLSNLPIRETT